MKIIKSFIDIIKKNMVDFMYEELKTKKVLLGGLVEITLSSITSDAGYIREEGESIDWKKVASKYDGIEINPYQFEARYQYLWYYGWDVASGCIWNLKSVKLNLLTDKGIE